MNRQKNNAAETRESLIVKIFRTAWRYFDRIARRMDDCGECIAVFFVMWILLLMAVHI